MDFSNEDYLLRIIGKDEYQSLFNLIDKNRNRLLRYFPNTLAENQNLEQTKKYLEGLINKHEAKEIYPFGIYNSNDLIGWISIKNIERSIPKCELGYYLNDSNEGKGIMTKVVKEILSFCFEELEMEKVFLRIGNDNKGSLKIASKNGFKKEGVLRNEFRIDTGELIDVNYFGKLKNEK